MLPQLGHSLVFIHRGPDGAECRLGLGAQSEGTLTWLATAGPAIQALRRGGVLVVDELDASLHPHLAAALIEMFQDPDLNTAGAQIIATTHDASLLGNTPTPRLEAAEAWFCEKDDDSSSSIYSLADFTDLRRASNKKNRPVHGVVSVPCFEVWLTAHYCQVHNYEDQHDAQDHYAQIAPVRGGEEKSLPKDFPWDAVADAAQRCRLAGALEPGLDTQGPCPSTTMPHLMRALGLL
ncbi:AAA family ATPase [Actinomyces sp. zg328]|uniref:AAA family ATPase n=1 Tax=Actinomyces sp. zg328 TaxID=2609287 RepID=UPI001915D766|nr:AAA family ATPase [Actinomyces sp. zg328]